MNEQRLHHALQSVPVDDARARTLEVVRAAYRDYEPVRVPRRRWLPALAVLGCLLAAGVVAASVGSPGDAVARWVREVFGSRPARPELVRVPGGGRLLVSSPGGPGWSRPTARAAAWAVTPVPRGLPTGCSWPRGAMGSCSPSSRPGRCAGRSPVAARSAPRAGRPSTATGSPT